MIYKNFEVWRAAKQKQAAVGCYAMRYFKLDKDDLSLVLRILQNILRNRVERNSSSTLVSITDSEANSLLAFIDECKYGYIHPRSASAREEFVRQLRTANPNT